MDELRFLFDDKIGTHRITGNKEFETVLKGTPVFFTSMLTGQRALDNGSFERLGWHINKVKKKFENKKISHHSDNDMKQ